MLYLLKRHPFPVKAFLRQSLVLTYAFPSDLLQPLLAPGLALDTYRGYGFLAIALVETQRLRPSFLQAALGGNFLLSGYRIFVRLGNGRSSLRGLRILRSDANCLWMVNAGNLLTHYKYRLCQAEVNERPGGIEWISERRGRKRICVSSRGLPMHRRLCPRNRRFFMTRMHEDLQDHCHTRSITNPRLTRSFAFAVSGVTWHPTPVRAEVLENTFLSRVPFCQARPILANAFYVRNVPYRWSRGVRISVDSI